MAIRLAGHSGTLVESSQEKYSHIASITSVSSHSVSVEDTERQRPSERRLLIVSRHEIFEEVAVFKVNECKGVTLGIELWEGIVIISPSGDIRYRFQRPICR